jgi:N-acetylglucosamine kinase-like BadF-type ATPase
MKLIADSGGTKTDWVLTDETGIVQRVQTQGINPFHQSEEDILAILHEVNCQLSTLNCQLSFYGSGVRPELEPVVVSLLLKAFPLAATVEAHSDLLGAARAVCGCAEGIACILGTGANSGLYDGRQIVRNTPPLGYVLGDEGSGAVLGLRFLNALYKGFMPSVLVSEFEKDMNMAVADVIARVYRQPMANRFLASLSPFISRHLDNPQVRQLVVDNFRDFFRRNLVQYQRQDLPVGFVGSIAWHYAEQLKEAAASEGFRVGQILQSPMDGLIAYHR